MVPAAAAASAPSWDVSTVDGEHGTDRENFDYALDPGAQVEDSIRIANTGDAALTVALYAADGFTTKTGEFDLRTRDAETETVGAWVALESEEVSLQPGESVDVPFRITVPKAARGEYVGGIVTSEVSDATTVQQREAVRVRLHVGSSFRPALSIEDLHVDYSPTLFGPGSATVTYTVRNSGDTLISSEQSLLIAGSFGMAPLRADDYQSTPLLLPGETWTMTDEIHGVLPLALLTATVSAVPLYVDAAGSTGPLQVVDQSTVGAAVPWLALVLVIVVLALLVWWLRRRRTPAAMPVQPDASTAP